VSLAADPVAATAPRVLLAAVVDYAGRFPPAGLGLDTSLRNYLGYRASPDGWALGRLVLPATALEAVSALLTAARPAEPVRLSAVLGSADGHVLDRIVQFNTRSRYGRVETVELKAATVDELNAALGLIPPTCEAYCEVPPGPDAAPLLERLASTQARAKLRTGGLTASGFPAPAALLDVLGRAVRLGVPLKATAGLHHALRGSYPLRYEQGAPSAPMFGFLNLMLAILCLVRGIRAEAEAALLEADPSALRIDDEGLFWRTLHFDAAELAELRHERFHGFGSCSFREPLGELARYGWA